MDCGTGIWVVENVETREVRKGGRGRGLRLEGVFHAAATSIAVCGVVVEPVEGFEDGFFEGGLR